MLFLVKSTDFLRSEKMGKGTEKLPLALSGAGRYNEQHKIAECGFESQQDGNTVIYTGGRTGFDGDADTWAAGSGAGRFKNCNLQIK